MNDEAVLIALGSNLEGVFGSSKALLEAALARLRGGGPEGGEALVLVALGLLARSGAA